MTGDPRRALVWKALLEIVLISTGVFIGLAAEQWRSNAQHRDQAHAALQRFKAEVETNQAAVDKVRAYHEKLRVQIGTYLNPKTRATAPEIQGFQPVIFEHTAWDLALATQSLADIDPQLTFSWPASTDSSKPTPD